MAFMELINDRYRVLKSVSQNQFVSSYIVQDLLKDNRKVHLNIMYQRTMPQGLIDFYTNEFFVVKNIKSSTITKLYSFGVVKSFDGKALKNNQYYFTREYIDKEVNFQEGLIGASEDDIIDIFIQICQGINYLHMKGYIYKEINIDNIYAYKEKGKFKIKLKDFATIEMEKTMKWFGKKENLYFKAPEILNGKVPDNYSDIYSLGVILLFLCKSIYNTDISLKQIVKEYKENTFLKDKNSFYTKIEKIIKKMTNANPAERYKYPYEIIKEINSVFGKEYKTHFINEMEDIVFNTRLIGREREIQAIVNVYNKMENTGAPQGFYCFYGDHGTGKTRLLKELMHIFTLKNAEVYGIFREKNASKNENILGEILRQMLPKADSEIIEHYEECIGAIIPEIGINSKNIIRLNDKRERLYFFNRITSFIDDCIKSKPTVFIIDNIQDADELSIEFLTYLNSNLNNNPIIFVASCCQREKIKKDILNKLIDKCKKDNNFHEYYIGSLTIEQTTEMIKNMLSMPKSPINLATRIYTETYGNPLFIEEVIKNLYANKIIFITDENSRWQMNIDDYDKLSIPSTIYQAITSQLNSLGEESTNILQVISIFNLPVSAMTVGEICNIDMASVEEKLEGMVKIGIVDKKVEDWGYAYDVHNKSMKAYIYNSLSIEDRKEIHRLAAQSLEKLYEIEGRENKVELIYHLEMAEEKNKVIEYCLETAEKMESIQVRSEALKNLEKALSMFDEDSIEGKKLEILMKMGKILREDGQSNEALAIYEKMVKVIPTQSNERVLVDIYNRISEIHELKNELDKSMEFCQKALDLVKKIDYTKGYLEGITNLASIYYSKQDDEKVMNICLEGLRLSHDKYIEIEGKFYNYLGIIYLDSSRVSEALECFKKCVELFEKSSYIKGLPSALNNIGVIYGDYLQDSKKSTEYFLRMKEMCEKYNFINNLTTAESNLAESYLDNEDYLLALEYFKNSLELSIKTNNQASIFINYINLCRTHIEAFQYKEAYDCYLKAKEEFEKYPVQRRYIIAEFYRIEAMLFHTFGYHESAYESVGKTMEVYQNEDFRAAWDSKILSKYISLTKAQNRDEIVKILNDIEELSNRYSSVKERIGILYKLALCSKGMNFDDISTRIVNSIKKIDDKEISLKARARKIYFMAMEAEGKRKIKLLETALDIARKEKMKNLEWDIYNAIGDYYFSKKQYYDSTKYYFEACEVIKNLALQIPEEYRLKYMNFHNKLNSFKKLLAIKNFYNDKNIENYEKNNFEKIENLNDLEDLFRYKGFWEVLSSKNFIKSAEKSYDNLLPSGINSIQDMMKNVYMDPLKNLDVAIKILAKSTLASRGFIISLDDGGYNVVASLYNSTELPNVKFLFEKVDSLMEPVLITESNEKSSNEDVELMPSGVKALICIPIIKTDYRDGILSENDKGYTSKRKIEGYIYLDSDRILNNFNEKNFRKCCDVTGLIRMAFENYKLKTIASIDKLTGAYTRKYLVDTLEEEFEKTNISNTSFSIIMFDLDKFKSINDRFGHQKGDYVLKEICRIVFKNISEKYSLCRYGGEEFIVILPETGIDEAGIIAEDLRKKVDDAKILGIEHPVTISLGVASYPEHARIEQELIEKVDQALYIAKESGRNRSQIWNTEISSKAKRKDRLAGIVSGNTMQDYRNVLAMIELVELVKDNSNIEDKIYKLLGRTIEITEAQYGMLFLLENNEVVKKYSRKKFQEGWTDTKRFNKELLLKVIKERQGLYRVDWDDITEINTITGSPDWQSVILVPIIKSGEVKGVLYLTISTKVKEFDFNHFNFVNTLGDITAAIL